MERSDVQAELNESKTYLSRMESRIVMIRNSAGTVQDPQVRNALQVDADMWQDEVDHLRHHLELMQAVIKRCESREKTEGGAR
jgi:predicted  nucleic acid-binding Zn-ribbon protein